MQQVYAHQATVAQAPAGDLRAALPDEVLSVDGHTELRILFATEPHRVDEVRHRIDAALAPSRLISSGCARIEPADRPRARQLLKTRQTGGKVS